MHGASESQLMQFIPMSLALRKINSYNPARRLASGEFRNGFEKNCLKDRGPERP